ncbi:Phenylacetate-coenzyme A ligase [Aquicella siphonis]|uniref:Phenylacetate-coenzyme A ligase n=1 Tax=Aquicella siphonis TaxID=254247 RepID=A0A5E4PFK6_9COXI|nr:phenylacetate--CoA ligase family protein [Aquicella siphonis]VVC75141.1 Phenylacetate-coenzyme A ligase [Aquicella siphonis]
MNNELAISLPIPSSIPGIVWPVIPTPMAAQLLSQIHYFNLSETFSPSTLLTLQFTQLVEVINFARKTVPYYRSKFSHLPVITNGEQLREIWDEIPMLSRLDLQQAKDAIFSESPLPSHEPSELMTSTGSTGMPVTVKGNVATQFFWNATTLRDHLWHKHDFNKTYAVIRFTENPAAKPPHGAVFENWGPATYRVVPTGKCHHLTICTTEEEVRWLRDINPHYLNCNPSTLREITQYFAAHGGVPDHLTMVHTNSEIVEPDLRRMVKEVMGVQLVDTYSTKELGYLALQCPEQEHYHVQSENVLVEIINEQGKLCEIDEPGRVVATALHNFASPLIRYFVGDYASPGEPCSCGRNLPVIKRILGRQRNMLKLPDGRRIWPSFTSNGLRLMDMFSGAQFQVIQKSLSEIHINLAHISPFSAKEEENLRAQLSIVFDYPFRFIFNYLEKIERGPGGKYEDFKCEVA